MALSINLRFDLKKLGDSQLADRLRRAVHDQESAAAAASPHRLKWSSRGLIRHPSAYPVLSVMRCSSFDIGLAFGSWIGGEVLGITAISRLLKLHLAICEVRDIMDELRRRGYRAT